MNETSNRQTTDTLLMVRPAAFACNEETAASNAFQVKGAEANLSERARAEFDGYADLLRRAGVDVIVAEDTPEPVTPDAVFPNNWFSTHEDGTLVLYPMYAENRRLERKQGVLEAIEKAVHPRRTVDLTGYEKQGLFLEGTGSMVLDRVNRIAYACRSVRTNEQVLQDFCSQLGYTPVLFDAVDRTETPVYHTNVMLHVGSSWAVGCWEAVADEGQRKKLQSSLMESGKRLISLTQDQMNCFAGNMLEVRSREGTPCLLLSRSAYDALTDEQIALLGAELHWVIPAIPCIERNGGGSARCMVAELFGR